jgi:hypothetical protein
MKAAKNEIKGLEAHSATNIDGLNYPLMALIDFKGYRVVASSLLPISGFQTLKYGSCDGGVRIMRAKVQLTLS